MPSIHYRPINSNEVGLVVHLHRAIFPSSHWCRSIFVSEGIVSYLANLIVFPSLQSTHMLMGAWDENTLVGYAYFRSLCEFWHLNYIAVAKSYQDEGVGRTLLEHWIEFGRERGYKFLSLDVDSNNQKAVDWYCNEGFEIAEKTWVYEDIVQPNDALSGEHVDVQLHGWETAEAWQSLYGFSKFSLKFEDKFWEVGRLGKHYFRIVEIFPGILKFILTRIDSKRNLLLFSRRPLIDQSLEEVSISLRMCRNIC